MRIFRIPTARINWPTSLFLISTLALSLTAVPLYVWWYGLDWFQVVLFLLFVLGSGLSITLGYHRLFAHLAFRASWPVRAATLVFGAASFEGSALEWVSDHRRHHAGILPRPRRLAPVQTQTGAAQGKRGRPGVGPAAELAASLLRSAGSWGRPGFAGVDRLGLGRRAGRDGRLLACGRGPDRLRSPLDFFHQLLLPHDWPAAIFEPVHGARQLDHGAFDLWRGLPQLPS